MYVILNKANVTNLSGKLSESNPYYFYLSHTKFGDIIMTGRTREKGYDGDHWQFIVWCAQMAQEGFIIKEIQVPIDEVIQADYDWTCPQLDFSKFPKEAQEKCRQQILRRCKRTSPTNILNYKDILELHKLYERLGYYKEYEISSK